MSCSIENPAGRANLKFPVILTRGPKAALAAVVLSVLFSAVLGAESRYVVVRLHPVCEFGTEKALILNVVVRRKWIWVESPAVGKRDGSRYVIYQGQLAPGERWEILLPINIGLPSLRSTVCNRGRGYI